MGSDHDKQTPVRASQLAVIAANHDNIIHGIRRVNFADFKARATVLDVTERAFEGRINAPEKRFKDTVTGETIIGREVVQILDLEKQHEKDQSIKDGFQAYPAIMKDEKILTIGLPSEINGETIRFLNAEQITIGMLNEFARTNLPEGAELAIVWRRDINKTQDVISVKSSELIICQDDAQFKLPAFETITCGGGIGKQKIEFGGPTKFGLYKGTDDDRISFNAVIPIPEQMTFTSWDAGLLPELELQKQFPNPQYFDAVTGFSANVVSQDITLPITSFFTLLSNQSNLDNSPQDHTCPFCNVVLTSTSQQQVDPKTALEQQSLPDSVPQAEKNMILHLLMHPELRWMRKLYGLDFDGDPPPSPMAMRVPSAHSTAKTDRKNRQVFQRPRQQPNNYDEPESSSPHTSFKMQQSSSTDTKDTSPRSSLHFFALSPASLQSKDKEQQKPLPADDEKEIETKKKKTVKKARDLKEAKDRKQKENSESKKQAKADDKKDLKETEKKKLKPTIQQSAPALPSAKKTKAEMPQEEMKKPVKAAKPTLPKPTLPKLENSKTQAEKTSEKKEKQKAQVPVQPEQKLAKEVQNKAKIPVQQPTKSQLLSKLKDQIKEKTREEKREAELIPKREIKKLETNAPKRRPKKQPVAEPLLLSPFSSPFAQARNSRNVTFAEAA